MIKPDLFSSRHDAHSWGYWIWIKKEFGVGVVKEEEAGYSALQCMLFKFDMPTVLGFKHIWRRSLPPPYTPSPPPLFTLDQAGLLEMIFCLGYDYYGLIMIFNVHIFSLWNIPLNSDLVRKRSLKSLIKYFGWTRSSYSQNQKHFKDCCINKKKRGMIFCIKMIYFLQLSLILELNLHLHLNTTKFIFNFIVLYR